MQLESNYTKGAKKGPLNSSSSFQVLLSKSKEKKKIGNGHEAWPFPSASRLTFQGGETCCQNESADNTSIGAKVRNPLENATNGVEDGGLELRGARTFFEYYNQTFF